MLFTKRIKFLVYLLLISTGFILIFVHGPARLTATFNSFGRIINRDFNFNSAPEVAEKVDAHKDGKPSTMMYAIFVIVDSKRATGNNIENKKMSILNRIEEDVTLQSCRLRAFCHIYLILYNDDDDKLFHNDVILKINQTAKERLHISKFPDRNQDARLMNEVVLDAYLAGSRYFIIVLAHQFTVKSKSIDSFRPAKILSLFKPSDIGVVLLVNPPVTSSLENDVVTFGNNSSTSILSYVVSQKHLDIFGMMFPYEIPGLDSGLKFLEHIYPSSMTRRLKLNGQAVQEKGQAGEAGRSIALDVVNVETEVLNRYLSEVQRSPCLRCNISSHHNVIAMSLYGSNRRYTMGAIRNAQLLPIVFPGWQLWFYMELPSSDGKTKSGNVPQEIITKITELGAEIKYIDTKSTGLAPMLWRFLVAEDDNIDAFIIRDSDSRLTPRDAAVVADWLKTDKPFHCIRDHPSHSNYAVSGGLWGGRPKGLNAIFSGNLKNVMRKYGAGYVEDMNFLGSDLWPKVKDKHAYCHDSFSCERYPSSHPFPVKRTGYEHLGEVYDEHSIGRNGDINILKNAGVNSKCVPT